MFFRSVWFEKTKNLYIKILPQYIFILPHGCSLLDKKSLGVENEFFGV